MLELNLFQLIFLSPTEPNRIRQGMKGASEAKAVANYDEDSLTMAAEAGLKCLNNFDSSNVKELCFCSTTAPYSEKSSSSILAAVLDLNRETLTTDVTNSLRSATSALLLALNRVGEGTTNDTLLLSADCRLGYANSEFEQIFGDASAAYTGNSNVLARSVLFGNGPPG
jgi:3-hydroxy-3-methylglutaryl CoA synthase